MWISGDDESQSYSAESLEKSICPCTVNLARKARSMWEWKPNACSKSPANTICKYRLIMFESLETQSSVYHP